MARLAAREPAAALAPGGPTLGTPVTSIDAGRSPHVQARMRGPPVGGCVARQGSLMLRQADAGAVGAGPDFSSERAEARARERAVRNAGIGGGISQDKTARHSAARMVTQRCHAARHSAAHPAVRSGVPRPRGPTAAAAADAAAKAGGPVRSREPLGGHLRCPLRHAAAARCPGSTVPASSAKAAAAAIGARRRGSALLHSPPCAPGGKSVPGWCESLR